MPSESGRAMPSRYRACAVSRAVSRPVNASVRLQERPQSGRAPGASAPSPSRIRSRSAGRAWALTRKRPGGRITRTSSGGIVLLELRQARDPPGPVTRLYPPASRRGPKTWAPRRAVAGSRGAARRTGKGYGAPVSRPDAGHRPKARDLPTAPPVAQRSPVLRAGPDDGASQGLCDGCGFHLWATTLWTRRYSRFLTEEGETDAVP
jgi:hypothetical protein